MDKKYILTLSLKKNTKNDVEKSLFKLMNNSAYGKIMENLRKRINFRLVNKTLEYARKRTFVSQRTFTKRFAAIHEIKLILVLNKLIYVGFNVLELSKTWVSLQPYQEKKWYWLIVYWYRQSYLWNKSKDVYENVFKYKHLFDFSEYKSNFFIGKKEFQSTNLLV